MSAGRDDGPRATREVAHRLFAAEFDDADLEYSESDEERAPNYVVTPGGLRVNRLFAVGVLTEVEAVNEDTLRGRVVDPTGAFVTYAGQYQPDEVAFLDRTEPPAFVALTGKARTFEPDDADVVYTSVRPESLSAVDADTRDRWTVSAAEATLRRVAVFARALDLDERGDALRARLSAAGVPEAVAAGVPVALDHYGTTPAYLEGVRRLATDALELVAGERDEVRPLEVAPGEAGDADLGPLPALPYDFSATPAAEAVEAVAGEPETAEQDATEPEATESETTEPAAAETTADADSGADAGVDDSSESTPATPEGEAETATESAVAGGSEAAEATGEPDERAGDVDEPEPDVSEEVAADAEAGDLEEGGGDRDLGDFEDAEPGDFEDVVSEEERREVEEEHGVEFESGSEVSGPGEADVETSSGADEPAASAGSAEPSGGDDRNESTEEPAAEPSADGTPEETEPDSGEVDLEEAVVELMAEFDDGDGADRAAVVDAAVDRYGVDVGDAEDAIQDALMGGKCYEPEEDRLKPI